MACMRTSMRTSHHIKPMLPKPREFKDCLQSNSPPHQSLFEEQLFRFQRTRQTPKERCTVPSMQHHLPLSEALSHIHSPFPFEVVHSGVTIRFPCCLVPSTTRAQERLHASGPTWPSPISTIPRFSQRRYDHSRDDRQRALFLHSPRASCHQCEGNSHSYPLLAPC